MSSQQSPASERKYEAVYRNVANVIAEKMRTPAGDPATALREIRRAATLAWEATFKWPWAENNFANKAAYLEHRDAAKMVWYEEGRTMTGSRHDWRESSAALYAKTIKKYAPPNPDLVLDLGCGWGHRLIDLYLTGLRGRFVGGDRSNYTRECLLEIAKLASEISLEWFQFDFLNPNYAPLPDSRCLLVYSCHAIEQVTSIGTRYIDQLIHRFPHAEITCVHLEPVSFQIDPTRERDSAYAQDRGFNKDLVDVVRSHGGVDLFDLAPAVMDAADGNTTALVVWRKRR